MVERGSPSNEYEPDPDIALETDADLEGVDFGYIAGKLELHFPDYAVETVRAGVDEDGAPMSLHELTGYIYGKAIELGLDPDEMLAAVNLLDLED